MEGSIYSRFLIYFFVGELLVMLSAEFVSSGSFLLALETASVLVALLGARFAQRPQRELDVPQRQTLVIWIATLPLVTILIFLIRQG